MSANSLDELVGLGTLTEQAANFLEAAVVAGLNMIVAGGTQAGKPVHPKNTPSALGRGHGATGIRPLKSPVDTYG